MNKSVMKCCICNNENIGRFITINNKKYHLCCIEQLQQENQQLKIQVSAREEEYRELEYRMNEISNFIEENKNKTIAPYGDNEDYDHEVCLDYDDITTLERIINNEYDYENR